jgi:hypothetical protein
MKVVGVSWRGQGIEVFVPLEVCRGRIFDTLGKKLPGNVPSVGRLRLID